MRRAHHLLCLAATLPLADLAAQEPCDAASGLVGTLYDRGVAVADTRGRSVGCAVRENLEQRALEVAPIPSRPDSSRASRTSFWLGAQADVVGLEGPSGSPALYGGNAALVRSFGASPWEAALVLSAASRRRDAPTPDEPSYEASTFGLYSELRYVPGARVRGPYLLGVVGIANTRVDDKFGGIVPGVGTDATTGVFGAGLGVRFRMLRVGAFADVQYQVRTTATHGRHAVPVRFGLRW